MVCEYTIFPYIALKKVEKGDIKTACVYVVEKKKMKYGHQYVIRKGLKYHDEYQIKMYHVELPASYRQKIANFPINQKRKAFYQVDIGECKKIQYIEILNIYGFERFFIYDYIQSEKQTKWWDLACFRDLFFLNCQIMCQIQSQRRVFNTRLRFG